MKKAIRNLILTAISAYFIIAMIYYFGILIATKFEIVIPFTKQQIFGGLILIDIILDSFRASSDLTISVYINEMLDRSKKIYKSIAIMVKTKINKIPFNNSKVQEINSMLDEDLKSINAVDNEYILNIVIFTKAIYVLISILLKFGIAYMINNIFF